MSQWQSGKRSDAKKVMMRLPEERGDDQLYFLDRSQVKALITLADTIRWMTRHYSLPSYIDTQIKLNDYADETANDLMTPIDFCSQLAACEDELAAIISNLIASNTSVQNAIQNFLATDETVAEIIRRVKTGATTGQTGENLLIGDCDPYEMTGSLIQIIGRLDQNNVDALEIIEVGTNDEERVASILEAIPLLGELPFGDIIDISQNILTDIDEQYRAAITEEWKINVVEDLYCIALENCGITYDQIFHYFEGRFGQVISLGNILQNIVELIVAGDFSTDELVTSGLFLIQLGCIRAGSEFNSLNIPKIGALGRDAIPSSAWEDFNECSTLWCRSISGADLHSMFEPNGGLGPQAQWTGTGYGANNSVINSRITLQGDLGASFHLRELVVIFNGTNAVGDSNDVTMYTEDFISVIQSGDFEEVTQLGFPDTFIRKFEIDVVSSFGTSVPITVEIIEIQVKGTGPEPLFGEECS